MARKKKEFPGKALPVEKQIVSTQYSTDSKTPAWRFDRLDRSGPFAFDLSRPDFPHREVLEKFTEYNQMTWAEIKAQTHDKGKSKHHFLDAGELSREAEKRVGVKVPEDELDSIFSFALQNKLRIIGVRKGEFFHPIWFDPNHEFCPSKKK